jgi:DNA-binding Lrp family transcriptional regulator
LNTPDKIRYSKAELTVAKNGLDMPRHEIDHTDLRLLSALQDFARISNVDLAKRIGITAPPCLRRVHTLEQRGYVRAYHAELDAKRLGFEVTGFIFVGLKSQADLDIRAFEESLRHWPIIRKSYALQGEVDFLLKCIARDLTAFQDFVRNDLMPTPNVRNVRTFGHSKRKEARVATLGQCRLAQGKIMRSSGDVARRNGAVAFLIGRGLTLSGCGTAKNAAMHVASNDSLCTVAADQQMKRAQDGQYGMLAQYDIYDRTVAASRRWYQHTAEPYPLPALPCLSSLRLRSIIQRKCGNDVQRRNKRALILSPILFP